MARTASATVTPLGLWRWRPSPLRRRSDVVEAWIVLATWVLAVVAGAFAGVVAGQAVDSGFAARAARAHAVSAVLTDDAARTPPRPGGFDDGRVWAVVRWTDADGSARTGETKVFPGAPAGTRVTVWADRADRGVSAPETGTAATLQAAMSGVLVAAPVGAAVWAAGWAVRTRLIRRRMAEWDEEWKRVGPQWGT
ncbi:MULTISPECIES: Rv1733c family protein [unclassified Streptomyces]|uniref:Rv1733c family protein n=1 Tax=unclassified Streptomyces TaxID=2593676 RepID=UPI0040430394